MDTSQLSNKGLEQSVLAALRWDPSIDFAIATDGLTDECFSDVNYRRVFQAMKSLVKQGRSIDDFALEEEMKRTPLEELPRGASEIKILDLLTMLMVDPDRSTVATNIPFYVRYLVDLQRRRHVFELLNYKMNAIADLTQDAEETVGNLVKEVTDANADTTSSIRSFGEIYEDVVALAQNNFEGKTPPGVKIGFKRLDTFGGFHPVDLVIIAAESSKGKTTLATTIAMNIAKNYLEQTDCAIAYYSLEMTPMQLIAKMLSRELEISPSKMIFQRLSSDEMRKLKAAAVKLKSLDNRIFVDERAVTTVESIMQSIRYLHAKYGVSVAFVDFLQILGLHASRNTNREQVIAAAARDFKNLAKELRITVVLISQFNRDSANSQGLSVERIRDSGEINEAADLTLLIERIDDDLRTYPRPWQDVSTKGTAMIKVAKDRFGGYGGVGTFIVGFNAELSYFYDLDSLPKAIKQQPLTTALSCSEQVAAPMTPPVAREQSATEQELFPW